MLAVILATISLIVAFTRDTSADKATQTEETAPTYTDAEGAAPNESCVTPTR